MPETVGQHNTVVSWARDGLHQPFGEPHVAYTLRKIKTIATEFSAQLLPQHKQLIKTTVYK